MNWDIIFIWLVCKGLDINWVHNFHRYEDLYINWRFVSQDSQKNYTLKNILWMGTKLAAMLMLLHVTKYFDQLKKINAASKRTVCLRAQVRKVLALTQCTGSVFVQFVRKQRKSLTFSSVHTMLIHRSIEERQHSGKFA